MKQATGTGAAKTIAGKITAANPGKVADARAKPQAVNTLLKQKLGL